MSTIDTLRSTVKRRSGFIQELKSVFKPVYGSRVGRLMIAILFIYIILAIIAPYLPVDGPWDTQRFEGTVATGHPPSTAFPLGTTALGYSVLSQTLMAFRTSVVVGLAAGASVVFVGVNIGLIAGYYGGKVDSVLMMIADFLYGLPLYPFAIIFVAMVGQSIWSIIAIVILLLWKTIARVTRSETLSLREREFVKAARAAGSPDWKIIYGQILPNLLPLVAVYFVFGATWAILLEAGVAFLGLGDPNLISWGEMLRDAFSQAAFTSMWWWVLAPALSLWIMILSLFTISRLIEDAAGDEIVSRR